MAPDVPAGLGAPPKRDVCSVARPSILYVKIGEPPTALRRAQAYRSVMSVVSLAQAERVRSVEDLERERQHYADLFEFAPHAYLVTDAQGKIVGANRESVELLMAPLVGKAIDAFIPMEQSRVFRGVLDGLAAAGGAAKKTWIGALQCGGTRRVSVEFTVRAIRSSSALTYLCWLLRPAA